MQSVESKIREALTDIVIDWNNKGDGHLEEYIQKIQEILKPEPAPYGEADFFHGR